MVPLKALVLVSLVGHVREIALQTKRGFPFFSCEETKVLNNHRNDFSEPGLG